MKRMFAALSCILLMLTAVFACAVPVGAEIIFPDIDAPQLSVISADFINNDCRITVGFGALEDAVEAEFQRFQVYETFVKVHGSAAVSSSDAAWSEYPFTLHIELSTDAKTWVPLSRQCDVSSNCTYSFYLITDALTHLAKQNENGLPGISDKTLSVRAYIAPSNCTRDSSDCCILSPLSDILKIGMGNIHIINYSLSGGTNSAENPPAYYSLSENVLLGTPTRAGYIFKGWLNDKGTITGVIPAGSTKDLSYTAKWEAKQYSIYYVLSQPSFELDFSRAVNKANPVLIFADESKPLQEIASPIPGYVLGGWYTTADFSTPAIKEIAEGTSHDITLYAQWLTISEKAERDEAVNNTAKRLGDADNDGKVSSADARLTLRHAVNIEKIDEKFVKRVDFFKTGIISSPCARTVLRLAVGLEDAYNLMTVFNITALD